MIQTTTLFLAVAIVVLPSGAHAKENRQELAQKVDACKAITINYFENGLYSSGDTDQLSAVMQPQDAIAQVKQILKRPGLDITLFNSRGVCSITVSYAR